MSFQIESYTASVSLAVEGSLSVLKISDDLFAYKRNVVLNRSEHNGEGFQINVPFSMTGSASQGFVNKANLAKIKKGLVHKDVTGLMLARPELLESLQQWGWQGKDGDSYKHFKMVFKDVYDALLEDPSRVDNLMKLDTGGHMAFSWTGEALPVALQFDYVHHGLITDTRYHIELAACHLLERDDVVIFPSKGGYRKDEVDGKKQAKTVADAIVEIPYYNRDCGDYTIYFLWRPSTEVYRKLWAYCTTLKSKYPSTMLHQGVFDLDLLGLRAIGAAKYESYHQRDERESSEDDE